MDQLRRIYARILVQPIEGIEGVWHAYDAFENALNKVTVRRGLVTPLCVGEKDACGQESGIHGRTVACQGL